MNRYLQNFVARCIAVFRSPRATLIEFGDAPPPWQIPLRDHLAPLIVLQTPTVVILLTQSETSALGYVWSAMLSLAMLTVQSFLYAGLLLLLSRLTGGKGNFNASFVLYTLAATPGGLAAALFLLMAFVTNGLSATATSGPFVTMVALVYALVNFGAFVFSLVLVYLGGEVVMRIPADKRVSFIVLWILSVIFLSMIFLRFNLTPSGGLS